MAELPWKPVVYLPTNLTVRLDAEVLQVEDPGPWCKSTAVAAGARDQFAALLPVRERSPAPSTPRP
jgi:hypothetical protein